MQGESASRTRPVSPRESSVRAIKLVLAYDGTEFSGWQRQKNGRSVQEELEKALTKMHGHAIRVTGAGRTDAGVHAMGQVAGFYTDIKSIPADRFVLALNKLMPRDVRVLSSEEAPPDFHARFDASLRRYRYFLRCGDTADPFALRYAHFIPYFPRVAVLNAAAAVVLGEHDFSTFASAQDKSDSRSRHISESVFYFEGGRLVYQVAGNAFLWRQVRSLVGTFLELERLVETPPKGGALMRELLESRDRDRAGATAPACGLFLWNVEYGERVHGHPRRRGSVGDQGDRSGPERAAVRSTDSATGTATHDARLVPGLGWIDECE
jgi:tRNA pseudouridine38-40 synthase